MTASHSMDTDMNSNKTNAQLQSKIEVYRSLPIDHHATKIEKSSQPSHHELSSCLTQSDSSSPVSNWDEDMYNVDEPPRSKRTSVPSSRISLPISSRDSLYNSRNSYSSSGHDVEFGSHGMKADEAYHAASLGANSTVDGLTPLLQAARSGDLVRVNALIIKPGTDILRRDPVYGQTALHFAIRGGHLPVVQALLMPELSGSIVNVPDSRRNTALHLAAAKSRRMVKLLIDCGAEVNFLNGRNQTPLGVHVLTVTRDDPTMTEYLLQARANPNASVDKSKVLHVAIDKGHYQIAQCLIHYGARLDLKDESGKMIFDKVDPDVLQMLLSSVAHAPNWIPNSERRCCMECQKKFGFLSGRRHHCRCCGRLVCSTCSSRKLKGVQLPFQSLHKKEMDHKQRVCSTCYDVVGSQNSRNEPRASRATRVSHATFAA